MFDLAFEELDVGRPGLGRVAASEDEHLGGHVEPVHVAGGADPLGGEQHVDAAAGTEIEHGLALAQLGDGGGVAAAEAGERGGVGQVAEVVVVGEAPAGVVGAAAGGLTGLGDLGRGGVVVLDLEVDEVVLSAHRLLLCSCQPRTARSASSRSGTARYQTHRPRLSRSTRPASTRIFM